MNILEWLTDSYIAARNMKHSRLASILLAIVNSLV